MKNCKRHISAFLVAMILMAATTGCTGQNTPSGNSSGEKSAAPAAYKLAPESENVSLRFLWWGGDARHKATLAAIEQYKAKHPNVSIQAEYQGFDGYYQKLTTQLAGNLVADIVQLDQPWLPALMRQDPKMFVDFKELKEYADLSAYDAEFIKNYVTFNDKIVGIPTGINGFTFFINKNKFESLGLKTDTPWTWDSLLKAGETVNKADPDSYLMLTGWIGLENIVKMYVVQQTGGEYINKDYTLGFNEKQLTSAFSYIKSMVDNHVVEPFAQLSVYATDNASHPKWVNEKLLMKPDWPSTIPTFKNLLPKGNEIAVMGMPVAEGAKQTGIICRPAQVFSIYSGSKYVANAAAFLNAITTEEEYILTLKDTRGIPASSIAREILVNKGLIYKPIINAVEIAQKNAGYPENSVVTDSEIVSITQETIQKVGFGKLTPEQAAKEAIKQYETRLAQMKAEDSSSK